ncbi:MAG: OmpA family protein [Steroidobacteraceae bacterium]|nr:OmpA family protein [Steroidobacteraceae bacterium]
MKKVLGTIVTAWLAAAACGVATAGSDVGSWYVAPQINGLWIDDARRADDDIGFTFSLGHVFSDKWDGELSVFTSKHDAPSNVDHKIQGFAIAAKRVFYREQRVNPFISIGIGEVNNNYSPGLDIDSLTATYGVGVLADIGGNRDEGTNLQLRGDIGARRNLGAADPLRSAVDYVAGLGLQYSWGGTPPAKPPGDADGDGVTDDLDKCPGTPAGTPVNADGCPLDSDGDGVTDDKDKCPNTPAGATVDATGCELDSDGDGVADSKDKCPNTPAGAKVDENGCELDSDGDGVVDSQDKCPDTPKGDRVDATGCSFKEELKLPGVEFDLDKATLRPESAAVLEGAVSVLKRYPDLKIEVAGHTDAQGSDAYNMNLSKQRAITVLDYLKAGGVTNELASRGYGERQPVASNATAEGRQENRRVVLRVLN